MNKTIGNNLKRLRDANRFTQEQLAVFLGINRSTYSNYEMGEREIPFTILEKAADFLKPLLIAETAGKMWWA